MHITLVSQCKYTSDDNNSNIFKPLHWNIISCNMGHYIIKDPFIKLRLHFVAGIVLRALQHSYFC